MKLLSIILITGSLLIGHVAFAKASCGHAKGQGTINSPDGKLTLQNKPTIRDSNGNITR